MQTTTRIVLYDRIKHWERKYKKFFDDLNFKIPGAHYGVALLGISFSCLASLLLTYPLDLAAARIMADIGNNESVRFKRVGDVFLRTQVDSKFFFLKFYKGMSLAVVETIPTGVISLMGSEIIYRYHNLKLNQSDSLFTKYWKLFGCMATLGFITSAITFPIDTIKRRIQVHNSVDFSGDNKGLLHSLNYAKNTLRSDMYK